MVVNIGVARASDLVFAEGAMQLAPGEAEQNLTLEQAVSQITRMDIGDVFGAPELSDLWHYNQGVSRVLGRSSTQSVIYDIVHHKQKRAKSQIIELIPKIFMQGEWRQQPQYAIFAKQGVGVELEHNVGYKTLQKSAEEGKFKLANRSFGYLGNTLFMEQIKGIRIDEFIAKLIQFNSYQKYGGLVERNGFSAPLKSVKRTLDHLKLRNATFASQELDKQKKLNKFGQYTIVNEDTTGHTVQRLQKAYDFFGRASKFDFDVLAMSLKNLAQDINEEYTWNFDIDYSNSYISDSALRGIVGTWNSDRQLYRKLGNSMILDPNTVISALRDGFGSSDFDSLGTGKTIVHRPKSDALAKVMSNPQSGRVSVYDDSLALHQLITLVYGIDTFDSELDNELLDNILEWDNTNRTIHRADIFKKYGVVPSTLVSSDEFEIMKLSRSLGKLYHAIKYFDNGVLSEQMLVNEPEQIGILMSGLISTAKNLEMRYQNSFEESISLESTKEEVLSAGIKGALTYSLRSFLNISFELANSFSDLYYGLSLGKVDAKTQQTYEETSRMLGRSMNPPLIEPNTNKLRQLKSKNDSHNGAGDHSIIFNSNSYVTSSLQGQRKFDLELYQNAKEVAKQCMDSSGLNSFIYYANSFTHDLSGVRYENDFLNVEKMLMAFVDYALFTKGDKIDSGMQPIDVRDDLDNLLILPDVEIIKSNQMGYGGWDDNHDLERVRRIESSVESISQRYQMIFDRVQTYLDTRLSDSLLN